MSDTAVEKRVTALEVAIFDTVATEGIVTRQKKADAAFEAYIAARPERCFFLNHQANSEKSGSLKLAKVTLWVKEIGTVIALVTLLAKAFGWF